MKSLLERTRFKRLAPTFVVLTTLSAGILIGSVTAHGVKGKEGQVNSSDATPLKIPNPTQLGTQFTQIAKEVGPAVVNISTETLPKQVRHRRGTPTHPLPNDPNNDGNGGDDDQAPGQGGGQGGQGGGQDQGPGGDFQDFFNRFFGGPGGGGQLGPDGGPGDGGGVRESLGSGFIVDPKGYILTNNHVVDKADKIYVKLSTDSDNDSDRGRLAKVVGVDPDTDVAVIKIETNTPLPTVKLGNSDAAQVGDWVVAMGSPFGLSKTVTAGIVSAKNRTIEPGQKGQFQHFIQTDAAINPGNSGGPLLNMNSEVVGINTAIFTQSAGYQGIGFAMPSNTVIQTYNDLIGPTHKVTRGSIGISFQPSLPSAVGRVYGFKTGVLVSSVQKAGPAEQAGLKPGDIITSVDGQTVKDGDALVSIIAAKKPGTTVKLGYQRNGKQEAATVTIADRSKVFANQQQSENQGPDNNGGADVGRDKLGITVTDIPQQLQGRNLHGVLVQDIKPGSFADEINLPPNTVITEINKQPINNRQDFNNVVSGLKSGQDVVFKVVNPRDTTASTLVGGTLP
jgi:serine protease Do